MAMTLRERTRDISERCTRLQDLNSRVDETRRLDSLLSELHSHANALSQAAALASRMRSSGISCGLSIEALASPLRRIGRLGARFKDKPQAASLTQGRDWPQMLDELKQAESDFSSAAKTTWKNHVNALYSGESTDAIRGHVPRTDENIAALREHGQACAELLKIASRVPENADDIAAANTLAERLSQITFNYEVPPAVKLFLDALSRGGASLDLLNDEVRGWLAKNNLSNRYQIVAVRS